MIVDDRITTYLHSLEMPDIPVIEEIEKEALEAYVPIIRKETQSFLKVLLTIQKPKRILEVGTWKDRMILFLWTQRKDSIFIICRKYCVCWRRKEY